MTEPVLMAEGEQRERLQALHFTIVQNAVRGVRRPESEGPVRAMLSVAGFMEDPDGHWLAPWGEVMRRSPFGALRRLRDAINRAEPSFGSVWLEEHQQRTGQRIRHGRPA